MEQFVRFIIAGGIALVAGLWLVALLERGSLHWLAGVALAVVGISGLAWGIASEIRY